MNPAQIIVATFAISFVTFMLTWAFVFKPRLDELIYQRNLERDHRIELQEAANPEGDTSTVKIIT